MKQLIIFVYSCYFLSSSKTGIFAANSGCKPYEWQCKSGQCISLDEKCDGVANCGDQSDESSEFCLETNCPNYTFKCAYGACVSGNAKCNGIKECYDGSDEAKDLCDSAININLGMSLHLNETSSKIRSRRQAKANPCRVTLGSNMIISTKADPLFTFDDGDFVGDLTNIKYSCTSGYSILGRKENICFRGSWVYPQPKCSITCPNSVIQGITFQVICSYNRTTIPCEDAIRPGTIATAACALGYQRPDEMALVDTLSCGANGEWDSIPHSCVPICGQQTTEAFGSGLVDVSRIPWHVAIYQRRNQSVEFICGGTIIAPKIIITAAHCVSLKRIDPTKYIVLVGKNYREYSAKEKLETQEFNISEIHIPRGYLGDSAFYHNDMAILVLNEFIRYQPHIKPACVEWRSHGAKDPLPNTMGKIAGWGRVSPNGFYSDDLRAITLPVIDRDECIRNTKPVYEPFVAADKFCIGSPEGVGAPCQGDSGSGFLVTKDIEGTYAANSGCEPFEWQCKSGQCISLDVKCDGIADSADQSDESNEFCLETNCPNYTFKCAYGACVSANAKCNGIKECYDGSDEAKDLCDGAININLGMSIRSNETSSKIRSPRQAKAGPCRVTLGSNMIISTKADPSFTFDDGDFVGDLTNIKYSCTSGYSIIGRKENICFRGSWAYPQPKCIITCPNSVIQGITFQVICTYNRTTIPCEDAIRPGTIATAICALGYHRPDGIALVDTLSCGANGEWDSIPHSCVPICGQQTTEAFGSGLVDVSRIPWHVAIYQRRNQSVEFICGGTIIAPKIIITAAHCVSLKRIDPTKYIVLVGKNYRDYLGDSAFYHNDMAVLVLNEFIRYRPHIKPACVEWRSHGAKDPLPNTMGKIAGWGRVSPNGFYSDDLRAITLPVIDRDECIRNTKPVYEPFVAADKFCIGSPEGVGAPCQGDSGSGFLVTKDIEGIPTYFLEGVISTSLSRDPCSTKSYVAFSDIQYHELMIREIKGKFTPK
ncbi:unnamed protein product [Hermetia illucens]|uniref:Peptidase S1 domain-containing protein n=1 Tax=Hermetia illucens TaxID=343691 RepID=A0A7R8Z0E0_HERIL|nr:unnamed protein product [Hermetia illucens]